MSQKLLEPTQIGDLEVKNRVALAPMTRTRAEPNRTPNELMAEYYAQRANAGLVIAEATAIFEKGIAWMGMPGVFADEHVVGWKKVVDAVHAKGSPIFLQIWHPGRNTHSLLNGGTQPVAPSAVRLENDQTHTPEGKKDFETPRALELEEIPGIIALFKSAAEKAKAAGFDGVEVHSANGYILDQFLQSKTNQRTDIYGGSVENRYRLLGEVIEAVKEVYPANRIGVRLAPNGAYGDMGSDDFREQFTYVASELDKLGLAYLHVMDGLAFGFHEKGEPMALSEFRAVYSGFIIGNCGYTQETAEAAVGSGNADMIAFGRPFISNPDLVERFAKGLPLAEEASPKLWYGTGGAEGYTDFPVAAAGGA